MDTVRATGPTARSYLQQGLQLYNDGYSVIMGPRHPEFLGAPYRECWPDTYPTINPWMQRVMQGEIVTVERTLIPVSVHG